MAQRHAHPLLPPRSSSPRSSLHKARCRTTRPLARGADAHSGGGAKSRTRCTRASSRRRDHRTDRSCTSQRAPHAPHVPPCATRAAAACDALQGSRRHGSGPTPALLVRCCTMDTAREQRGRRLCGRSSEGYTTEGRVRRRLCKRAHHTPCTEARGRGLQRARPRASRTPLAARAPPIKQLSDSGTGACRATRLARACVHRGCTPLPPCGGVWHAPHTSPCSTTSPPPSPPSALGPTAA